MRLPQLIKICGLLQLDLQLLPAASEHFEREEVVHLSREVDHSANQGVAHVDYPAYPETLRPLVVTPLEVLPGLGEDELGALSAPNKIEYFQVVDHNLQRCELMWIS